jgi:hypothetical protein
VTSTSKETVEIGHKDTLREIIALIPLVGSDAPVPNPVPNRSTLGVSRGLEPPIPSALLILLIISLCSSPSLSTRFFCSLGPSPLPRWLQPALQPEPRVLDEEVVMPSLSRARVPIEVEDTA